MRVGIVIRSVLSAALAGLVSVSVVAVASPAAAAAWPTTPVAWGDDRFGQATISASLNDVVAVDAGATHSVAVRSDGTVVAWGNNASQQAAVPAGLTGVVAVEAGEEHTLALKANGTVVAWGRNHFGQTAVPAGLGGVVAVAAGAAHSLALKGDGTVVGWGYNDQGQTTMPAFGRDVVAIAAGYLHSVALLDDGTVVAWGWDSYGQTLVPPGLDDVVAIAAGTFHTLALKADGTVVAWGDDANNAGQLAVPDGLADVVAIAAGYQVSVALKDDGTVVVWGKSSYGLPIPAPAGLDDVVAVAAGFAHVIALTDPRLPQTISFTAPADRLASADDFTVAPTASSDLPVAVSSPTPDVCSVVGTTVDVLTAGTCTLTASQDGNAQFRAATPVAVSFLVGRAPQAITFPTIYDRLTTSGPYTYRPAASSGLAVTTVSDTPDVCSVDDGLGHVVAAGTCTLTASQDGNASFLPADPVSMTFTVSKAPQTITFPAIADRLTTAGNFTVAPTASSGLPVAVASASPAVCAVASDVVSLLTSGTCTLTASQAGDGTYLPADPVSVSFQITAPPVVTPPVVTPPVVAPPATVPPVVAPPSPATVAVVKYKAGRSTALTKAQRKQVAAAAATIRTSGAASVTITVDTDGTGSAKANVKLAAKRGKAIVAALKKAGVTAPVTVVARGESAPAASNKTKAGRAANRRATITTL